MENCFKILEKWNFHKVLSSHNAVVHNYGVILYFFDRASPYVILVNDQPDAHFLNVFISCLYLFRATSAHHQEDQLVSIHHLV
jgi:hypothetical protein